MNKPLIRSLMIACVASMTLPAQGVMIARNKAQDPKPTADAPKSKAQAKVDVKALHEKLMKALEQADLSDAERAKVMETLAKALQTGKGKVATVSSIDGDMFVVGDSGPHEVKVLDEHGKPMHGVVVVKGGDHGENARKLLHEQGFLEAKKGGDAQEGHTYRLDVKAEEDPAAGGEQQFRIRVFGEGAGERAVVIAERAGEEGEAAKVRWTKRAHGEQIEIAEPMLLELEGLRRKLDQQHQAVDVQHQKADEMRARAEKLRAATVAIDPAEIEGHDVRVFTGDAGKTFEISKDVEIQVTKLRQAMAEAHEEGRSVWVVGGDEGPAVFQWTSEAPAAGAKGKKTSKAAKADDSDDLRDSIRELREELRELRKMMKQIRKELREEDDDDAPTAPAAPLMPASFPAPAVAPAPNFAPVHAAPLAPAAAPAFGALPPLAPASVRAVGSFPAAVPAVRRRAR